MQEALLDTSEFSDKGLLSKLYQNLNHPLLGQEAMIAKLEYNRIFSEKLSLINCEIVRKTHFRQC